MSENGVLATYDGRPALRFERRLAHAREKVWQAVTEPAELSRWYPLRVVGLEPRVGGRISFDDGEGTIYPATVTDFEPPLLFAFDEHDPADSEREYDDHLRVELHEDPAGCLLVFTHVMADPSIADGVTTGWRACLDALPAALDA
ncbi:SRPBCC domain-containing protein [Streptomyces sp. P38-E01]|uniref:SRPBCC domain-containing protein n=1 Tax=Streptomyces tardus TaxID=2780544 RepID=A0A949N984_9ACTN|nr:SRPBCC domain-containing protein [Streptomyces tardus]MBU7599331.1 SRPBCC domain-containing protein [Streptomyces tardus]